MSRSATVIGAGPVGCLLAVILRRKGYEVEIYEARSDMRRVDIPAGRSINLVLTERGLRGLGGVGLRDDLVSLTVPVTGRMIHAQDGTLAYQPYGKDDSECNYSISRGELNKFLVSQAEQAGAHVQFDAKLVGVDFGHGAARITCGQDAQEQDVAAPLVFGCDGGPSAVRNELVESHGFDGGVEPLGSDYKELLFASGEDGTFLMEKHALHIWPRGHHMLMALPNQDGSFTGTLYLPSEGPHSFGSLADAATVDSYFAEFFADAMPLLGDVVDQMLSNPKGRLGTVRCAPWSLEDKVLLVGDSAHGIVPFFGQGLNCGFEDCAVLAGLLDTAGQDLAAVFAEFFRQRKANADAIADMALENFVEMRDRVGDPAFLLRKQVSSRLEKAFPERFRSRYAMVMYSSIPYHAAMQAGCVQSEILDQLCSGLDDPAQADLQLGSQLIDEKLSPLLQRLGVSLEF